MEQTSAASTLVNFIPIILILVPIFIFVFRMAKKLGENAVLYGILSLIPFVNAFALLYMLVSAMSKMGRKLDRVVAIVEGQGQGTADP
jgi:hypothetical protein